jgi:hypothetical protein
MSGELYVTAEDIPAGTTVVIGYTDGKAYRFEPKFIAGGYLGRAGEQLREGFRVGVRPDGDVYEDDA